MKLRSMAILMMILLLVVTLPARGADPLGKVVATLNAEGDQWVGQRIPLTIKILAPGFSIDGIPVFDLPEISGLLVLKLPGSPRIGNETLEDRTYVTQEHEFALFPQRAGELTVPTFPVRFSSSAGYGKPVTPFQVKTQPLKFTAKLPPGAEGLRTLISTNRLTVEESWSPDVSSVTVGDAVTRTITMQADDIPGMEFPPLPFSQIEGLGIYPKPPVVTETSNRGSLAGQRVESVTYLFEKPGKYLLPGMSLTWWKLDDKVLKQETMEARTISVAGPADTAKTTADSPSRTRNSSWNWTAGITVIIAAIAVTMTLLLRRKPDRKSDAELALFAALEASCRMGDRQHILAALTMWLDHTSSKPTVIHQWAVQSGDNELVALIGQLEADLYQRPGNASNSQFPGLALLEHVRRFRHRQPHSRSLRAGSAILGPLNP